MPAAGGPLKPLGKNETIVNAVVQEFAQAQTTGIEVVAVAGGGATGCGRAENYGCQMA